MIVFTIMTIVRGIDDNRYLVVLLLSFTPFKTYYSYLNDKDSDEVALT